MSVTVATIIKAYEKIVPLSKSLDFDHNGLKIGHPDNVVHKIMGCLEITTEVLEFAIAENIDMLFVHHDPLFIAPNYLRSDDPRNELICQLINKKINVYASHTNLDIVENGLNDYIFTLLGGTTSKVLNSYEGIGRYGAIKQSMVLSDYIDQYIKPLQSTARLITHSNDYVINKIAVVNGSGAKYYRQALQKKVDLFISGDVDYHTAMMALEYKIPIIDIGHDSECVVDKLFTQILQTIVAEQTINSVEIIERAFNFTPWTNI